MILFAEANPSQQTCLVDLLAWNSLVLPHTANRYLQVSKNDCLTGVTIRHNVPTGFSRVFWEVGC